MTDSNNRTSLLVNSQLPAFIREEHATFVKFMEYYYKFLEQDGQLQYVTKNFPRFLDIDEIKKQNEKLENQIVELKELLLKSMKIHPKTLQKINNQFQT